MINMHNSMDVLRMGTGGVKVQAPSALDNAVIASLRGPWTPGKRELEREVSHRASPLPWTISRHHALTGSSLSSVVVDGKFDVVREEEQVQDTRDIHRLMHDGAAESEWRR
jgi:hypothetical protein